MTGNPQIRAMLVEAVRVHQSGRPHEAAALYQKVLALDAGNPDALNLLGMVAMESGQPQAGCELIRKAIAADGRQPAFHFNLGLALQSMGQLDEAAASYRRALTLKPNDPDSLTNLGSVLAALGRLDEAETAYRRALESGPQNPIAHNNLGTLYWNLGRKDEAESHYRQALALKPDYADALNNLGNAARDKGQLGEAAELFRRALALAPRSAVAHNSLGLALWDLGKREDAENHYRKALELDANLAPALANLGIALWEKGMLAEAERIFRRALAVEPQNPDLLNNFAALSLARGNAAEALEAIRASLAATPTRRGKRLFVELAENSSWGSDHPEVRKLMTMALTEPWSRPGKLARASAALIKLNPAIGSAVERAGAAWPARLPLDELMGGAGFAPLAQDALLKALLTSAPNTDMALERFLTLARAAMAEAGSDQASLDFCSALARQCFINEYVFLPSGAEQAAAEKLREQIGAALKTGADIAPRDLLILAAYIPLYSLAHAEKLLERTWPAPVEAVLAQQISEPMEEARLKGEIPRLTPIRDSISRKVREQYEENPYPRWVKVAGGAPANILSFLSEKYPHAAFERQPGRAMGDFLVAGCGSGQHSIATALKFGDRAMLAVDLSLSSLAYARRKSRELGLEIEYGQADILELGGLKREFDVIESLGVLHHMKDPFAGWQALLSVLRPFGFMWLGFYSERARANIVAARAKIAQAGIGGDPGAIRKFRQELADGKHGADNESILKSEDFYSVSAARDLLFHAQEQRLTLPAIDRFLKDNRLTFLGFELDDPVQAAYRQRFPDDPAATNLANWDCFEEEHPGLFAGMYVFWIQKHG